MATDDQPQPAAADDGTTPFVHRRLSLTLILGVAAAGVLILMALVGLAVMQTDSPAMRRAKMLDRLEHERAREIPSLQQFLSIEHGMTYRDVVRIIGREGVLATSSVRGSIYTWKRARCCANMSVHFREGRVVSKSQAGLE